MEIDYIYLITSCKENIIINSIDISYFISLRFIED